MNNGTLVSVGSVWISYQQLQLTEQPDMLLTANSEIKHKTIQGQARKKFEAPIRINDCQESPRQLTEQQINGKNIAEILKE